MYSTLHQRKPNRAIDGKEVILYVKDLAKYLNCAEIARKTKIPYYTVRRYIQMPLEKVLERKSGRRIGSGKKNLTSKFFDDILIKYIETLRTLQIPVHMCTVVTAAKQLAWLEDFKETDKFSFTFSVSWAKLWCRRNGIVLKRLSSSKNDKLPDNWIELGEDMLKCIKYLMKAFNITSNYVLNVDETPLFMENTSNYTLDMKGKSTKPVMTVNNDKERITFLLSITAEGVHLPPFVVIHGKLVERLVSEEVRSKCPVYCNGKAWMTITLTIKYI